MPGSNNPLHSIAKKFTDRLDSPQPFSPSKINLFNRQGLTLEHHIKSEKAKKISQRWGDFNLLFFKPKQRETSGERLRKQRLGGGLLPHGLEDVLHLLPLPLGEVVAAQPLLQELQAPLLLTDPVEDKN
jgi:hypothetical protein